MRLRLAGAVLAATGLVVAGARADVTSVLDASRVVSTNDQQAALLRDAAHIAMTRGLPLALVQSEVLIQDEAGRLQAAAMRRMPATFGGLWIDQKTGLIDVAFTRGAAASVATLAATFSRPGLLRPVTVARSYRDLKALQGRMVADRTAVEAGTRAGWPGLAGMRYAIDIDIRENRPVIVTDGHTPATEAALRAAYGDLRVDATGNGSVHACSTGDCRFYLRSGLALTDGFWQNCSTGFAVTSGYSGDEFLTAAHCETRSSGYYYQGGSNWGGSYRALQESGSVDALTAKVTSANFKAGPWIFVNASEPARRVTSMQSYSSLAVGQWICKTGGATGYSCGSVLSRDYSSPAEYPTPAHTNFMLTDMCDGHGDSGAGIYIGGQAVGLISAGNDLTCGSTYRGWHGHVANAASALGAIVLTSISAPFFSSITSATGSTIQVHFSRPVKCTSVNASDFSVKLQNQVAYTVTGASCGYDSSHDVTVTTSLPLVKATSITVAVTSGSIWDPQGQGIPSGSRTTTVT